MRFMSFVLALFLTTATFAAGPAEIDRASSAIAGSEAQFTQKFTPKGFKNSQTESGTVVFGTLPMMRWSYTHPEEKAFVFDGSKSWFYVAADRQVTVSQIDDAKKRELPFLLIGDPTARSKYFGVAEKTNGGTIVTTLQPRDITATIRNIEITTSATSHVIQKIEYTDRDGNRTSFELTGYHPKSITADTFRFIAPAGVQTVNAN